MSNRPLIDYYLSKKRISELNKLLKTTINILDKHNIMYYADGGTMLGAIRHKGQIPWDDDADICCSIKDYDNIVNLGPLFTKAGYKLYQEKNPKILKVYAEGQWEIGKIDGYERLVGTPTCDIFFVSKNNVGFYNYHDKRLRTKWSSCYHHESNLFPLQEVTFDKFKIKIPKNPIPYLDRYYKDWDKKIIIDERRFDNPLDKTSLVEFKIKSLDPFIVTDVDPTLKGS